MTVRTRALAFIIALASTACGDSGGPSEVTLADLAGDWTATKFEFARLPSPNYGYGRGRV